MMVILLQFVKKMDANLGEAHAALLTSKFAASFGCPALILEGDSLLTIVAIKDPLLFSHWASLLLLFLELLIHMGWKTVSHKLFSLFLISNFIYCPFWFGQL
jgi:hypothetical protein